MLIIFSISAIDLGVFFDNISQPSSVKTTSSSMRIPIPRYFAGTLSSSCRM